MKKRILSLLLALVLVMQFGIVAFAERRRFHAQQK